MSQFSDDLLRLLRNPKLNLILNTLVMGFTFFMAAGEWLKGSIPVALTLTFSGMTGVTGIIYWILIWLSSTMPPKN